MCWTYVRYRDGVVHEFDRVCHVVASTSVETNSVVIARCGQAFLPDVVEQLARQTGALCIGCRLAIQGEIE